MAANVEESRLRWKDAVLILLVILALAAVFFVQVAVAAPAGDAELRRTLDEAARHFQHDDYAGARDRYQHATQLDPGSIPAWRGLGWSLWRLGDEDRAVRIWTDIRKVAPDDAETLLALGQARESHEDWDGAEKLYTHALDGDERNVAARVGRARLRQHLEQYAAAEDDLRHALAVTPDDFEAQYLLGLNLKATGREDEAHQIFLHIADRHVDARFSRAIADVLLEVDRPQEALGYYRKALPKSPDSRGVVLGMARSLARLEQYGPAIRVLSQYLDQHPDDSALREQLVRFSSASGDYPRAIEQLQVLIQEHPDDMSWRVALARSTRDAGNLDEATRLADAVLQKEPHNLGALELRLQIAMLNGTREERIQRLVILTDADPTSRRFVRLGNEYLRLGEAYASEQRDADALKARRRAAEVFQRAMVLEPLNSDAAFGAITALRLAGDPHRARTLASELLAKYPTAERARREMFESYMSLEEFRSAQRVLAEWRAREPDSLPLREDFDRTRFHLGEQDAAIADLRQLVAGPIHRGVPVLLYHGLSMEAPAEDTLPLRNFTDQMEALHREGYTSIGMRELLLFQRKGAKAAHLPKKPVMITFDDARADAFRYADPVLKKYGFRAVMFTPTAEVGRHGDYNASWSLIRSMARTGRWDIQCHSHAAHVPIPVDANGGTGFFLANRMWLVSERRLETRAEFLARLDADYRQCRNQIERQVPGAKVEGYAYPYGELGQRTLSNEPLAVQDNTRLVTGYFKAGFVQDETYEVTRLSRAERLERFEVPWDFTGKELVHQLHLLDAYTSTQLLLAELYSWDGRYAQANRILDEVAASGRSDDAAVLTRRGAMTLWQGDYAGARGYLSTAAALQTQDAAALESIADLDRRTQPQLTIEGDGQRDNRDRDSFEGGPAQKIFITDRLELTAKYLRLAYADKQFDLRRLNPANTAVPAALRTSGNEYAGEIGYRRDARTGITLSGGAVEFNDRSSTGLFAPPRPFTVGALEGDLGIGENIDLSLHGGRGYVPAAGAVLQHLGQRTLGERLEYRPLRDTTLAVQLDGVRYDDSNRRTTLNASVMQRVVQIPDLQLGYRFRSDNTRVPNPFFYSPDHFVGHDALLQVNADVWGYARFGIELALGEGRERATPWRLESSALGQARFQLGQHFNVYATGGYDEAGDFRELQALAGFLLTF